MRGLADQNTKTQKVVIRVRTSQKDKRHTSLSSPDPDLGRSEGLGD